MDRLQNIGQKYDMAAGPALPSLYHVKQDLCMKAQSTQNRQIKKLSYGLFSSFLTKARYASALSRATTRGNQDYSKGNNNSLHITHVISFREIP